MSILNNPTPGSSDPSFRPCCRREFLYTGLIGGLGLSLGSFLQLVGAGFLSMVVLTHVCEALQLFSTMQWGSPDSVGYYLDLCSAILGLTLFPLGYLGTRRG